MREREQYTLMVNYRKELTREQQSFLRTSNQSETNKLVEKGGMPCGQWKSLDHGIHHYLDSLGREQQDCSTNGPRQSGGNVQGQEEEHLRTGTLDNPKTSRMCQIQWHHR